MTQARSLTAEAPVVGVQVEEFQMPANPQGLFIVPAPMHRQHMVMLAHTLEKLGIPPTDIAVLSLTSQVGRGHRMKPDPRVIEAERALFLREFIYFMDMAPLDCPVVCFGQEAANAVGLKDQLTKTRGFSYWRGGRRFLATWHPFFIEQRPETYLDLLEDLNNALVYKVDCPVSHDVLTDAPVEYPWTGAVKSMIRLIAKLKRNPTPAERAALEALVPDPIPTPLARPVRYKLVDNPQGALQMVQHLLLRQGPLCLDIETSGFDQFRDKILCVAIGYSADEAYIVEGELLDNPQGANCLRALFTSAEGRWVLHNAKFDCRFLLTHPVLKAAPTVTWDTMLMHYCLDERIGTHGLKMLARRKLGLPEYESAIHALLPAKSTSYTYVPTRVLHLYAAQDVCYTLQLLERLQLELELHSHSEGLNNVNALLIRAENAFIGIENTGIHMDLEAISQAEADFKQELQELEARLRSMVGESFNPRSAQQVAAYLYDVLKYKPPQLFQKHHDRATSREALDKLLAVHPDDVFLKTLIEYRMLAKILSTYVTKLRDQIFEGRLHTDFKLHGTVTGRLSASNPNVQNIPRPSKNKYAARIRNFFRATPGWVMIGADYKSAELRVATLYSHEPFWRDAFARGVDVHSEMSKALFGDNFTKEHRMIAKMMVFGLLYGRGANSIAIERGWSQSKAKETMRKFFSNVPRAEAWLNATREQAISQGFLTTPVGRMRRFGLVNENNLGTVSSQAVNFPVSSFASDCCLLAFILMHEWFNDKSPQGGYGKGRCLIVVHDAIYLEAPEEFTDEVSDKLAEVMRSTMPLLIDDDFVNLDVDLHVATSWGEL